MFSSWLIKCLSTFLKTNKKHFFFFLQSSGQVKEHFSHKIPILKQWQETVESSGHSCSSGKTAKRDASIWSKCWRNTKEWIIHDEIMSDGYLIRTHFFSLQRFCYLSQSLGMFQSQENHFWAECYQIRWIYPIDTKRCWIQYRDNQQCVNTWSCFLCDWW